MSDVFKSLVLIACLALIGFLVWMKVDGSVILATSAAMAVVTYFTQPPKAGSPPATGVLVGSLAAIGAAALMNGCSLLESPKAPIVADLALEKAECVLQHMKEPPAQIALECVLEPADVPRYLQLIAAAKTGMAAPDAGAP
jgi:hypothetical protein